MRLGLNVFAFVAIILGVVAGAVAAAELRPLLAVAAGAAATCAVDFGYRLVSGNFEQRGGFLDVRHALGSPTRIPLWIPAFGLAAGLGAMSFLKTPGSTPTPTYEEAHPTFVSPFKPTVPPAPMTPDPVPTADAKQAAAFLTFYKEWLKIASDPKLDCGAILHRMRAAAHRNGEAVHAVYASGLSLPPDTQTQFENVVTQLKTAVERCPDIQLQDEIGALASGDIPN